MTFRHIRAYIACAMLALICACAQLPAQQPATPATANKRDDVLAKADLVRRTLGEKKTTLMKGNVKFTHGDTILTSDMIECDEALKTASSPGKVSITNPESDITGDKGMAYFKKKLGVVEGNVVMHMKPKAADKEKADKDSVGAKLKEPTTITCPKLEYLYKDKIATATGGVVFKQEKRSASADKAVYDQKKELLVLTGDVKGVDEKGETFSAPQVTISLKKGDEWMEAANATSTFKIDLSEDEAPKQ